MILPKKIAATVFIILFFILLVISFGSITLFDYFNLYNLAWWERVLLLVVPSLAATAAILLSLRLLLVKTFLKPVDEFNTVAQTIIGGNLGVRIKHESQDELGELAANINLIINKLTQGIQGMANSLRDEKLKEKELASNNAQLEQARAKDDALLSSMGEAVIAIGKDKKIFLFNNTASNMTGYSDTEVIGQDYHQFLKFVYEKESKEVPDFISPALEGKTIDNLNHLMLLSKWGAKTPVTQVTTPMLDQNKQILGAIVVIKDTTRERQLDKLKDEFVSVASHELRTPMTAIKGLISMIFEGDYGQVNPELKEPLQDVSSSTERLINLVNDMLDVSRLEGGRVKYTLEAVDINQLVREILNLLVPIASPKGISLKFNPAYHLLIQADANKVKEIISNLVGNSLKFTDKGFIEVTIKPQQESLLISVRDTGMGMKPEDQKRLFGKFQQITTAQTGRPVGTGLGLYISREYAKKMGGDLWISFSQPGQGSVFTMSLPLTNTQLAKQISHTIMQESKS